MGLNCEVPLRYLNSQIRSARAHYFIIFEGVYLEGYSGQSLIMEVEESVLINDAIKTIDIQAVGGALGQDNGNNSPPQLFHHQHENPSAVASTGNSQSLFLGFDAGDTNKFWPGVSPSTKAVMPVHRDSEIYNMGHHHRGKAVIFNHENFHPSLDLGRRHGTERDKVNLKATLTALGFDVVVFDDLTFQEVRTEVEKLARDDHKERDCLFMCVLSHGDTQIMYAKDYSYKPDVLWNSFTADKCASLAGKPKIFFIQACQGNQLDEGTKLVRVSRTEVDSNAQSYKIPNHADFLIAFSTVPGFYSWRNTTNGSWFVQAICSVLQKYSTKKDLLSMMTIVSREVALTFESNTPSLPHMNQKKQIPFITSTLIREIYLVPKK